MVVFVALIVCTAALVAVYYIGRALIDVHYDRRDPFHGYFDHFDKHGRYYDDPADIDTKDMTMLERDAYRGKKRIRDGLRRGRR